MLGYFVLELRYRVVGEVRNLKWQQRIVTGYRVLYTVQYRSTVLYSTVPGSQQYRYSQRLQNAGLCWLYLQYTGYPVLYRYRSRPRGAVDSGLAAVLAAVESVAVFVRVCVVGFGWMVVRFVRVTRAVFVRVCVRLGLGGWL